MKTLVQITILSFLLTSCANIVMPTGGEKDTSPPKLLKTFPQNNSVNFKEKSVFFEFDENIAFNKWGENFNISPKTEKPIKYKIKNRTLILDIENQLKENTTYSLNLNQCIKDINEGNVLDNLIFSFSTGNILDSLNLKGTVVDAKTLKPKPNVRVFLHESNIDDSLSFKTTPKYATKTNAKGDFIISNLNNENYNLFCITGLDYMYHEEDLIGFYSSEITAQDTNKFVLFIYDPLYSRDKKTDSITSDSIKNNTKIIVNCELEERVILELYKENKLIKSSFFDNPPYIIENVEVGVYELRLIIDQNKNNSWDPGNHKIRKLPEKVYIYKDLINIRENWTFDLDCFIN